MPLIIKTHQDLDKGLSLIRFWNIHSLQRFTPIVIWLMRLWLIFVFTLQGIEMLRRLRRGESIEEMIQTLEGMNLFPGVYWAILPVLGMVASWLLFVNAWVPWAGLALVVISVSGLLGFHGHHLFSWTNTDYQFPLTVLLLALFLMVTGSGHQASHQNNYQVPDTSV